MLVELEVSQPNGGIQLVRLKSDTLIGRSDDCNLRIRSKQVSRKHCQIELTKAGVCVRDLESSNGTFVNGKRISAHTSVPLSSGCRLMVGSVTFTVRFEAPVATRPPEIASEDTLRLGDRPSDVSPIAPPETEIEMPAADNTLAASPPATELVDTVGPQTTKRAAADGDAAAMERSDTGSNETETAEVDRLIDEDGDPTETLADEPDLTWRQSPDDTIRTLALSEDEDLSDSLADERPRLDETLPEDDIPLLLETMADDSEWELPSNAPRGTGDRQPAEPTDGESATAEPGDLQSMLGFSKQAENSQTEEEK
jgi:pSer/pThr/pTyr-binding forkhead associated (FHA) protein